MKTVLNHYGASIAYQCWFHRKQEIDGAMEILLSLVSFDPKKRAAPIDVINSKFMSGLIEDPNENYDGNDIVKSYTAYLTK